MKATLTVEVDFNPNVTDAESIATAADQLLKTALSTPGIMDEYANPRFYPFFVAPSARESTRAAPIIVVEISGGVMQEAYSSDPTVQLRLVDWDTEGCVPDGKNGIFEAEGSSAAHVVEVSTIPIADMPEETHQVLQRAGLGPDKQPPATGAIPCAWT